MTGRCSHQCIQVSDMKSIRCQERLSAWSVSKLQGQRLKGCLLSHTFPAVGALFKSNKF